MEPLRLSTPVLTNGSVQLIFNGEAGVEYVVQTSTDLKTWASVITNSDPQITRTFDLGPVADFGFVRTARKPLPVFSAALMATRSIDLNGWNLQTDSFDSGDPLFSVNGLYPSSIEQQKDNGHVLCNGRITNSVGVGSYQIKGHIRSGPTNTISLGSSYSVGSKTWVEGNNSGIQPGYASNDMNVLYNTSVPTGSYYSPSGGTVGGISYSSILDTGNYVMFSISGTTLIRGNAKLYVAGSINLTGTNYIHITTNASLKLYMAGAYANFGGGGVVNETKNAASFFYYGMAPNTSANFPSTTNNFYGVIYAPVADIQLSSNTGSTNEFTGAVISKSIKLGGPVNFHFDENLMRVGPMR